MTVPERFTRDYGCSVDDWLRWLPGAVRGRALRRPTPGSAEVDVAAGRLHLRWQPKPEQRIALIRMPRLEVSFEFDSVPIEARADFMRYFDLYTLRGGG
jgi:hypothetical protein